MQYVRVEELLKLEGSTYSATEDEVEDSKRVEGVRIRYRIVGRS